LQTQQKKWLHISQVMFIIPRVSLRYQWTDWDEIWYWGDLQYKFSHMFYFIQG